MEEFILTVTNGAETEEVSASSRLSILDGLRGEDAPAPEAPCGGAGTCHKCTIIVTGKVRYLDTGDIKEVTEQSLLACRYAAAGHLSILIPQVGQMNVVTSGAEDLVMETDNAETGTSKEASYGVSVDIGTTTVAAFLYDLTSGKLLASTGERNAQRAFGADVISRITCCSEGKLPQLTDSIQRQIIRLTQELCQKAQTTPAEVRRLVIAGNTVMEHLFTGLSPVSIGQAPFTPESFFGDYYSATTLLPNSGMDCDIYLCPCLSGYVGGDITAGLMATDSQKEEGLRLFVDIGTNGEMALGNKEGYTTCATAAGPAFEGAEISCGMGGEPGAIDKIRVTPEGLDVHVIGALPAKGICGSGLVDAIACMLKVGVLTESGRLLNPEDMDQEPGVSDEFYQDLQSRIFKQENGHNAFRLLGDVYISAEDVREVQLAKAAIRAGAETLLEVQGKTAADITDLVIAGGFGSFLNKESALAIGLLPEVPLALIRHVGNAAGAGASLALQASGLRALEETTSLCSYLELSTSSEFMDNYIEYMSF